MISTTHIYKTFHVAFQVEQEVTEQIEVWEKTRGKVFLVGGARFVDFIKKQWEEYKVNKEQEKNQRVSPIVTQAAAVVARKYVVKTSFWYISFSVLNSS